MRDDFDSALADQFKVLDQVPVPDTWSRIRKTDRVLMMLDLETAAPTEPGTDPGSVTETRGHRHDRPRTDTRHGLGRGDAAAASPMSSSPSPSPLRS